MMPGKTFLCTRGDASDVSPELMNLLIYISDGSTSDSLTRRLDEAVEIAKKNPRWRKEYMDFQAVTAYGSDAANRQ